MRILITGAGGMLGQDLCAAAAGHELTAVSYPELDVTDAGATERAITSAAPDVVINCAAWTDVDGAEASPEAADAVNADGAANVARAASQVGAWTVQISTDYVFDGTKLEPYLESDPPAPLSAYGSSKLRGELAVAREAPAQHTIVRSSWLFGTGGRCFPATILGLAAQRDELTVVDDQIGCPTFTGHLASALIELAEAPVPGILHVAAEGRCSWCEFALEIVQSAGLGCEVKPMSSAGLERAARRPANSVLRSERGAAALPDWHTGLAEYLASGVLAS